MKLNKILLLFGATTLFAACSDGGDGPGPNPTGDVTLEASTNALISNGTDQITFKVLAGDVDVTSQAEIYRKDTKEKLSGPSFSTTKSGTYTFFAVYNVQNSKNEVSVLAVSQIPAVPADPNPSSTSFVRRLMGMQFTGTTCTFCPWVTGAIHSFAETPNADKVIFTAVHVNIPTADPMATATTTSINSSYGSGSAPEVGFNMNRKLNVGGIEGLGNQMDIPRITQELGSIVNKLHSESEAKAGIAAAAYADVEGKLIVVNTQIKAAEKNLYRVGAWVLENGIEARQTNGYNAPGEYNIHDAVVREVCGRQGSNFTGDLLGEIEAGATKDYVLTMPIDNKWNLENCYVVVFVSTPDGTKYFVNNIIECELGGSKAYEYK